MNAARLRAWARHRKYARLIRRSRLFDAKHYLDQLADPEPARRDPIRHFLEEGAALGLDPNPLFDTKDYVERHPQAAAPGKNPLVHFIRGGAAIGANPGPLFHTSFYVSRYPDVVASGMNPLAHYLHVGAREGRICFPGASAPPPGVGTAAATSRTVAELLSEATLANAAALALPAASHVLVVDHRLPAPDQDSGSVRMVAILELLRELGHEVTFVADTLGPPPRYERALRDMGLDVVLGSDAAATHLAASGHRYRFALLSRPSVVRRYLPLVRAHAFHATVIYDTVDLVWLRLSRQAALSGDAGVRAEAEASRAVERFGAQGADLVLAISEEEREALAAEAPEARVEVLPNIHAPRPSSRPWAERKGLVFIGGFEHPPNADAVEWFASEILPLVRRRLRGIALHVIGSKVPPAIARLASSGVHVAGWVPDPTALFEASRVFVAPLRYGAGMKGKIGHAMSHGLPVVTTSVGAEGMRLVDGEHVLVADGPEAFAAAVVRLHEDEALWSTLARNSLRHVEDHFSARAVRATVAALFPPSRAGDARAAAPPAGGVHEALVRSARELDRLARLGRAAGLAPSRLEAVLLEARRLTASRILAASRFDAGGSVV